MPVPSHIANVVAIKIIRNTNNAFRAPYPHNAYMDNDADKNGGPNHLRAWMDYRGIKGVQLADALNVTPGMVSDLVNSNRALSAKWLRRIAPTLQTTPGHLLDHDPRKLSSDIVEIWLTASDEGRQQLLKVAQAMTQKEGTND